MPDKKRKFSDWEKELNSQTQNGIQNAGILEMPLQKEEKTTEQQLPVEIEQQPVPTKPPQKTEAPLSDYDIIKQRREEAIKEISAFEQHRQRLNELDKTTPVPKEQYEYKGVTEGEYGAYIGQQKEKEKEAQRVEQGIKAQGIEFIKQERLKKQYYEQQKIKDLQQNLNPDIDKKIKEYEEKQPSYFDQFSLIHKRAKDEDEQLHYDVVSELYDNDRRNYAIAKNVLQDTKSLLNAPTKTEGGGFSKAGSNEIKQLDTWVTISGLADNLQKSSVVKFAQTGKPLTKSEESLLDAIFDYYYVSNERAGNISKAYAAGQIAGKSISFMIDFVMTGGFASGATGGFGKAMAKRVEAKLIEKFGEATYKKLTKTGVDRLIKAPFKAAEELTAGAMQAPMTPTFYSSVTEEVMPKPIEKKEGGGYVYQQGTPIKVAVIRGMNEVIFERSGEFIGDVFSPLGKALAYKNYFNKIKSTKLKNFNRVLYGGNGTFAETLKKTGFNGMPLEMGEEVFGQLANYVTGASTKEEMDEFFSKDNFQTMLMGFAPMTGVSVAGNMAQRVMINNNHKKATANINNDFGDKAQDVISALNETSPDRLQDIFDEIMLNNDGYEGNKLTDKGKVMANDMLRYVYTKAQVESVKGIDQDNYKATGAPKNAVNEMQDGKHTVALLDAQGNIIVQKQFENEDAAEKYKQKLNEMYMTPNNEVDKQINEGLNTLSQQTVTKLNALKSNQKNTNGEDIIITSVVEGLSNDAIGVPNGTEVYIKADNGKQSIVQYVDNNELKKAVIPNENLTNKTEELVSDMFFQYMDIASKTMYKTSAQSNQLIMEELAEEDNMTTHDYSNKKAGHKIKYDGKEAVIQSVDTDNDGNKYADIELEDGAIIKAVPLRSVKNPKTVTFNIGKQQIELSKSNETGYFQTDILSKEKAETVKNGIQINSDYIAEIKEQPNPANPIEKGYRVTVREKTEEEKQDKNSILNALITDIQANGLYVRDKEGGIQIIDANEIDVNELSDKGELRLTDKETGLSFVIPLENQQNLRAEYQQQQQQPEKKEPEVKTGRGTIQEVKPETKEIVSEPTITELFEQTRDQYGLDIALQDIRDEIISKSTQLSNINETIKSASMKEKAVLRGQAQAINIELTELNNILKTQEDAIKERNVEESNLAEYKGRDEGRETAETSRSDSYEQGGQEQAETQEIVEKIEKEQQPAKEVWKIGDKINYRGHEGFILKEYPQDEWDKKQNYKLYRVNINGDERDLTINDVNKEYPKGLNIKNGTPLIDKTGKIKQVWYNGTEFRNNKPQIVIDYIFNDRGKNYQDEMFIDMDKFYDRFSVAKSENAAKNAYNEINSIDKYNDRISLGGLTEEEKAEKQSKIDVIVDKYKLTNSEEQLSLFSITSLDQSLTDLSSEERVKIVQDAIEQINDGKKVIIIDDMFSHLETKFKDSKTTLERINNLRKINGDVTGFTIGNEITLNSNQATINKCIAAFEHERQHVENKEDKVWNDIKNDIAENIDNETLQKEVSALSGNSFYEGLSNNVLADEYIAYVIQKTFEGKEIKSSLKYKNIIQDEYRKRNGERLSILGRGTYPNIDAERRIGQNIVDNETGENRFLGSVSEGQERERIISEAKESNTYLKAPNGNPTKLNENQWVQVRTKAFKDWFGDWENDPENASKVVDENGDPLVVYHGSPNGNFSIFKSLTQFTKNKLYADRYQNQGASSISYKKEKSEPKTYETYLSLKNPFDTRNPEHEAIFYEYESFYSPNLTERGLVDWMEGENLAEWLQENYPEFDGILLDEGNEPKSFIDELNKQYESVDDYLGWRGISYMVFSPTQIKSATDNTGEFSESSDDIRFKIEASKIDSEYFSAIERGDMEEAQRIVDQQAVKKGYVSADEYKDAHVAPSSSVDKESFRDLEAIRKAVVEDGDDTNVFALANGISNQPDDYFSANGARWYGYDDLEGRQSASAIKSAMRNIKYQQENYGEVKEIPMVTVYRTVTKDIKESSVRNGDWVTPSENYAKSHGEHRFGIGQYRIIKQEIPADNLWWDGNDINEWGVDDGKEYAYQNTKNNRKLTDVIVRDDNGEIIPPSKRFNKREDDIRFSIVTNEQQRKLVDMLNEISISEDVENAEESTNYRKAYIERYKALKDKLNAKNPNIVEIYQDVLKYLEALANDKTWSKWDKSAKPQLISIRNSVRELKKAGSIYGLKKKLEKALDIVLERQNETARKIIDNFVNQKLEGKKGKGVIIPKKVDAITRQFFDSMKEWMNKDSQSIENKLQNLRVAFNQKKEGNERDIIESQIKALTYIQNYKENITKQEDTISNIIIDINRLSKEYILKDIRKDISSKYNTIASNKKKLDEVDERGKVDIIEANINLKKEIEAKQNEYKSIKQDIKLNKSDKEQLTLLKSLLLEKRISMQNSMESFIKELDTILKEGIKAKRLFVEREEARKQAILQDAYSDLAMSETESVINPAKKEGRLSIWRKILDPIYTFSYMLKSFAVYSPDGRGKLYERFLTNGVLVARQKELNGLKETTKAIDDKIVEIFGEGNHIIQLQKLCNDFNGASVTVKTKVNKFNIEKGEDEVIEQEHIEEINNGQALYIYAIAKMSDGMIKLNAMGIYQEQIDAITATLDPKLIEFIDWSQDEYLPLLREKYNNTHIDLFGTQLDQIDKYFPLNIDRTSIPLEVDIEDKGNIFGLPTTATGAIIKRVYNKHAIDIKNSDAIETFINHIQSMEKWNAYAPVIKELNILNSDNTFKKHINRYIYNGAANQFKDMCAIAVGSYVPKGSTVEEAITTASKLYARSKIVLRINTALKQQLSLIQIIGEADAEFIARAIKNIANPLSFKWALDNLPLFEERWESRTGGDDRLSLKGETTEGKSKKIIDIINKASNIGMLPNAAIDLYVCGVMAKAMYETKYNFYKNERGYNESESINKALKDAEIVYNESQQSAEDIWLSRIQKDRTFMAASISLFNNASFAYQRLFFEGITTVLKQIKPKGRKILIANQKARYISEGKTPDIADKYARNDVNRALSKGIMQIGLNGYLVQFVWNLGSSIGIMKALQYIIVLLGDDDDKNKEIALENLKDDIKNSSIKSLTTPVRGLPLGKELESLVELYLKGWNIRQMNIESNPLIADTKQTFSYMSEGFKNNDWVKIVNAFVRYSSGFTSVDLNTIANATYSIYNLIENHENITTTDVLYDLSLIINSPKSEQKFLAISRRDDDTFEDIVNRYIELKRVHQYGVFSPLTKKEDSRAEQDVAKMINVRYYTLKEMLNEYDKAVETYNKFNPDNYIDLYQNASYERASTLKAELGYTAKKEMLDENQMNELKTAIEAMENDESLNEIYKKIKRSAWSTSRKKEPELE